MITESGKRRIKSEKLRVKITNSVIDYVYSALIKFKVVLTNLKQKLKLFRLFYETLIILFILFY